MAPFDPYHNWLGIPPHEQPASFYRLLGLVLFESNADVIGQAAERQSQHIASLQNGPNGHYCAQLLGEIGQAAACLLDPQQKASYDNYLQESLSARGERSVMAAPPPPSAYGMTGPFDQQSGFNGFGPPDPYSQQPMQNGGWQNGGMQQPMPPGAFGQPVGEMPMPQFNLPPALGAPSMPQPTGFAGMNSPMPAMNAMSQPMPSYLPGPPAPMLPNQIVPNQNVQVPMQPQAAMQQVPMPQARRPQPAPFPKAPRPIPVANRVGNMASAVAGATVAATAATASAPQPPPPAPPRHEDGLPNFAPTPIRRRFKKKRDQVPTELIFGGILLASAALGFVIYAYVNSEKHGFEQIDAPKLTTTTAADAAAKDLKQAQSAKESGKKTSNGAITNSAGTNAAITNDDKRSRSITTIGEQPKLPNRVPPRQTSSAVPSDARPSDIVPAHQFGPPAHGLVEETGTGSTAYDLHAKGKPDEKTADNPTKHADAPPGPDVMENIIGSDPKNPKN